MQILQEKVSKARFLYGWVDMLKKLIVCLFIIALYLPTANSKTLLRDTYTISVIANGKEFFSTYISLTIDGKKYPFYVYDKYGERLIYAYGFGQLAVEFLPIEGISEKIAKKLGVKDFTFYPDLGITLMEVDPYEADNLYLRLKQEQAVKYVEISLIEAPTKEE